MGALRGRNPFFSFFFFYSSIISISLQMGSGRIIFYCNPLNGHYLYLRFFPITRLKRKHSAFLRGNNSVMATHSFWQTPQIMFHRCPAIRKKWSDKIHRGYNSQPSVYFFGLPFLLLLICSPIRLTPSAQMHFICVQHLLCSIFVFCDILIN